MTLTAEAFAPEAQLAEGEPSDREDAAPGGEAGGGRAIFASFARRTFGSLSQEEARRALQVRPAPVAGIRRSGPDPYRVLMFGGGALEGMGLLDHNLGLPGRVADQLATETGRGVDLDVVVAANPTASANIAGLGGLRLRRYDAVLVVLGDHPASGQFAPALWRGALVGLMRVLLEDTAPLTALQVWDSAKAMAAVSAGGRRVGSRLTGITEEVCAMTRRVRFTELPAPLEPVPTARFPNATHQAWADLIVTKLRPTLAELDRTGGPESPRAFRDAPDDERLRQRALACLGLVAGRHDERLDLEVRQAKRVYQVEAAALTIVDSEWTWTKASTGPIGKLPRADTICDWAIRSDRLTVVEDVFRDPRTRAQPSLQRGSTRFYAGYPIRTWDGYRVGMLCIRDGAPRTFLHGELNLLRDIATRVEQIIWSEALKRHRI